MHRPRTSMLVHPLRRLMRRRAKGHARNLLSKLHAADVARLMGYLEKDEATEVFALLLDDDPEAAADALSEMEPLEAVSYLQDRPEPEIARILGELGPDDAAELVSALPEEITQDILDQLGLTGHEEVRDLLGYSEETAGRIMIPEFFALREDVTVQEAVDALRSSAAVDLEMVFYLYVTDAEDKLVGVCSLRQLLLHDPEEPLREVMSTRLVSVSVDTDQEEVAHLVARYNLLALPVVDHDNRLVGIVTVDDVIDIIREEETEDILLMAGVGEDEEEVLTAPLWRNAVMRLPWLLVALAGGVLASQVIRQFEPLLAQVVILAAFIPVIVGMGGNIGTQAATIVVRGLATGRLAQGPWYAVWRELRVAFALGALFGLLLGGMVLFVMPEDPLLALTVGLSLGGCMAVAATVGAAVPILLDRFGVDPAIATGPFVTTSIDMIGVLGYLAVATVLLI